MICFYYFYFSLFLKNVPWLVDPLPLFPPKRATSLDYLSSLTLPINYMERQGGLEELREDRA